MKVHLQPPPSQAFREWLGMGFGTLGTPFLNSRAYAEENCSGIRESPVRLIELEIPVPSVPASGIEKPVRSRLYTELNSEFGAGQLVLGGGGLGLVPGDIFEKFGNMLECPHPATISPSGPPFRVQDHAG